MLVTAMQWLRCRTVLFVCFEDALIQYDLLYNWLNTESNLTQVLKLETFNKLRKYLPDLESTQHDSIDDSETKKINGVLSVIKTERTTPHQTSGVSPDDVSTIEAVSIL
jgi:hypothetical protein